MQIKRAEFYGWVIPLSFIACTAWVVWHLPVFILDFHPPQGKSDLDKLSALINRGDILPGLPGLFGGYADIADWTALFGIGLFFILGLKTVTPAPNEYKGESQFDTLSMFIGRVTMMLIAILVFVMMYEIVLRYGFNAATIWATELSLWFAGFVFLCAGLYTMQQRGHIRIFIVYDLFPRPLQHVCDVISTVLIVVFAAALIYGGYGEAFAKFYRWETFGTAFDPPIPATLKPMVLIIVGLVAVQAVVNLICDWNDAAVAHLAADDIDASELEVLKKSVLADRLGSDAQEKSTPEPRAK